MAKKVTVTGEAKFRNPNGGVDIEFYEEEFNLDDSVTSEGEARQIIRRGLITERLAKQKNFKGVRTCQVTSFDQTAEKAENGQLDQLLTRAAQLQCIPVNINNYRRPDYKIKALQDAVEKAEERLKAEKSKKPKIGEEIDVGYVD